MGIVYTSKDNLNLRELTTNRAVAALPVAGRYRIIDFTNGILRPFPHTFPESTTAAQLTEAIEALYTLTELKTKLQTPTKSNEHESIKSNEHESIKAKIATLEKTVTAILPPHLHPQILPQKCPL